MIFGAGASYDSSLTYPVGEHEDKRPPLAKDLFAAQDRFKHFVRNRPELAGIIDRLRSAADGEGVEAELERMATEAEYDDRRWGQMNAALFYIRDAIRQAEEDWLDLTDGVTSYARLLDQLSNHLRRRESEDPIALVTFNYDTLLDVACQSALGVDLHMEEYLRSYYEQPGLRVFKVHGSVNWHRVAIGSRRLTPRGTEEERIQQVISLGGRLNSPNSDEYGLIGPEDELTTKNGFLMVPAVALPLTAKDDFVMPARHVEGLRQTLAEVTRVLIVGWRGADTKLLDLWAEIANGNDMLKLLVVSGSFDEAKEVADRIGERVPFLRRIGFQGNGFSDFMRSPDDLAWLLE